nr:MAG TPA: hypothetical protein [Caudoviricetes sp.]
MVLVTHLFVFSFSFLYHLTKLSSKCLLFLQLF